MLTDPTARRILADARIDDLRSEDVPNGFERIRLALTVKGDAPDVRLRALADRAKGRSVVYDMVSNAVPVAVEVSTA